jgi:hypothetical protein
MKKDKRKELCLTNEERQTYDSQTKSDLLLLAVINLPYKKDRDQKLNQIEYIDYVLGWKCVKKYSCTYQHLKTRSDLRFVRELLAFMPEINNRINRLK